jgi:hypothetical protein
MNSGFSTLKEEIKRDIYKSMNHPHYQEEIEL